MLILIIALVVVVVAVLASGAFVVVGRRSDYYRNPVEDALILRVTLPGSGGSEPNASA